MVYANDQWVQLPTKDLYDTQMMAMAINAARDMYEKGQKQLDDFNTKYGDFMTPIAKDQAWYDQHVTGAARDLINKIYASGGDPLKSPEARAAIARFVHTLPTGQISNVKQSAAAANEYLKNRGVLDAKGLYNPDFEERFLGNDLNNWDTSVNGVWNRTAPAEFKTLKEATEPWYNNRTAGELSKEDVEAFGMQYDPRNKYVGFGHRQLMDVAAGNTPGWQGSVYADYYRDLAKKQVIARGEDPTAENVEKQLQRNVAKANEEWLIQPTSKADEWALQRQKQADAVALENLRYNHQKKLAEDKRSGPQSNQWSFAELVRRSGTTAILGKQVQEYNDNLAGQQRDAQIDFGIQVMNATGSRSHRDAGLNMYKNKYGQNIYRRKDIVDYFANMGYKTTKDGNSIVVPKEDFGKFHSLASLASNTVGFRSRKIDTDLTDLQNADVVVYTPTQGSYQAFMKNGRNEAHFEGSVQAVKYKRNKDGSLELDNNGNPKVDMQNIKQKDLYLDSDIKSVKNDPRLGTLKGPKGQPIVNTQDTRYQNAIQSDKQTTDDIVKGTIYGTDAILSEELGWGE